MPALATAVAVAAIAALALGGEKVPGPPSGAELKALARAPVYTSIASQRVYFVMPDRYANGDPANDRSGGGYNPADTGYYHGGDLKGLTGDCTGPRGLARVRDLGFTAVWITPPFGQKPVQGSSAAYHGYWIRDFTAVDPHLGTEADFAAFVDCAHRLALKVYLDVVVNHTADVIQLSDTRYSATPRAASVPQAERNAKRPAWLNDVRRYHNRGDIDFGSCSDQCFELGDFFGLDDLATEQPRVVQGLADVYASWIRRYRVDGFRIDTARHVDARFFHRWVPRIRAAARAAGVPAFELFGEAFVTDAIELSGYVRSRGLPNLLDFALQDAAASYAGGGAGARGMAARLADDDYFRTATGIAPTPPTFLGNHDMGRAALEVKQGSQSSGDELLRRVDLGHSLLYLLRGAPVVYYGDEVGMIGRGGDQQARQDMFPTAVEEWQGQERVGSPPIGTGSSFDVVDHPVARHLKALGALREVHPALSTGATIVRSAAGSVLVVSRVAGAREYVAAFNAGVRAARVTVATATPSSNWAVLLGGGDGGRTGADRRLTLELPALSAVLVRAEAEIPAARPARPTLRAGADDLSGLVRVAATVRGSAPVSVAFAVRRERGKRWMRLGVDDSAPYRVFLDPARYRRGERLHLVAIARALDGRTAVSRVVPLVARR